MDNLPDKITSPAIPDDTANVKQLPTEEPWEVAGYSEEIGISLLKRGKVIKISTYKPKMTKDYHIENH